MTTNTGSPLNGRVALITGASEGIGAGMAQTLAAAGVAVMLTGRRAPMLETVAQGIAADAGGHVATCVADVTEPAQIDDAVSQTVATFGTLDILITAAGFSRPGPAYELPGSDAAQMIHVGLLGTFLACQAAAQQMRQTAYGKIITLSSTLAATTSPGAAVYSSVKAAITHLTRALAAEWAADGIRVNALAPTAVETPSRTQMLTPELREKLLSRIPLRRFATLDDLAPALLYLAGPDSDFVTGQTLYIDGGWTAAQ